ncbi:MAG TPA: hypothetical protein DD638_05735, partial [Pasteurellaceae bacterium]|nr:hypothetical protein [Pasteurellaceae bacterium]
MELLILGGVVVILFLFLKPLFSSNNDDIDALNTKIYHLEKRVDVLQRKVDMLESDSYSEPENTDMMVSTDITVQPIQEYSREITEEPVSDMAEIAEQEVNAQPVTPTIEPFTEESIAPSVQHISQVYTTPTETVSEKQESDTSLPGHIWNWLVTGNLMLKVGIVVLFLGLAFLLRFASEHVYVPVEGRYLGVAVVGVICGIIGWRLRHRYREYGLSLQGASIAILYLTALATLKLHSLLPPLLVFAIQVSLVALMIFLAVLQDARILAQIALLGGLASPILISDGSGNYIGLFTYLTLLNTGVAGVAWFKSWRSLNIIGATGTFIIASAWGAKHYHTDYFAACQGFLIFHVVLYTLIVWRFALHRAAEIQSQTVNIDNNAELDTVLAQWWRSLRHIGILDGGLLFGVAFTSFLLQSEIANFWARGVMWSAFGFAAFYCVFGYWILRCYAALRIVAEAMLFLALVFITLAIGNGFEGWYKTTLWAIEAGLIYWFGIRQASPISRFFALNLFIGAWLLYFFYLSQPSVHYSLTNSVFLIAVGLILYVLWCYRRSAESAIWEKLWISTILALTVCLALMIPFYEHQLGRLTNEQTILLTASIILTCAVAQWWRRNIILAVFSVIGLATTLQYHFISSQLLMYLSLTAGITAWCLHKPRWLDKNLPLEQQILGFIGLIFSTIAFLGMLLESELLNNSLADAAYLIITFTVVAALALLLNWRQAGIITLGFLPLWGCRSFVEMAFSSFRLELFLMLGLFGLAAILHGLIMAIQHRHLNATIRTFWHALGLNVFIFGFTWLVVFWANEHQLVSGWMMTAYAVVPLIAFQIIRSGRAIIHRYELNNAYCEWGSFPIWLYLIFWAIGGNISSSALSSPLPYIPIFNPLELATAAFIYLWWNWSKSKLLQINKNYPIAILGAFILFMLSIITMRMWHHYTG